MNSPLTNTCIRFVKPVTGAVTAGHFEQTREPVPEVGEGQLLVRVVHLSMDPSQRRQMMPGVVYAEPLQVGDVMVGRALGRVVESRHAGFAPGDWVRGKLGWQAYCMSDGRHLERIDPDGFAPTAYLSVLGNPGITAWVGLHTIAQARAGETVVISAACGAVGSVAAAIARDIGCRVVGIAGGERKCALAVERLGYEACVDHRDPRLAERLAEATPHGVDVDFENVGGEVFDQVLARMNDQGRVALCGLISQYNLAQPQGLRNVAAILNHNLRVQGFRLANYAAQRPAALADLKRLLAAGAVTPDETVVEGLERAPQAFIDLFRGVNIGKMLVRVAAD